MRVISSPPWPLRLPGAAAAALALALVLLPLRPAAAAAGTAGSAALRAAQRERVLLELSSWPQLRYPDFTVYYPAGMSADARIVASAAERYDPEVMSDFGLAASPPHAVLIVVSPAQMERYVGAPGASGPPLGAYYEGVIWLLAPSAFLSAGPGLAGEYSRAGPVPHELTHLANDLVSGGRTPVWLDEGLASYEDWRLTGYVWVQPGDGFADGVYSWRAITAGAFYALPNLALAFRQAMAVADSVCGAGPGACVGVLKDLRSGMSVDQALRAAIGPAALSRLEGGAAWRPGLAPQPGAAAGPAP